MREILVLGVGSSIMTDDGIGIYLVEDLKKLFTNTNMEFITGETDVDYCLSEIYDSKFVIIIDAFLSGRIPGDVTVIPLCSLEKDNDAGYSLHGMHFLNILQCLEYEADGILIGIEPYEINYGFGLSDELKSTYADILKSVKDYINEYIQKRGGEKYA